jgi:hypothetical protein
LWDDTHNERIENVKNGLLLLLAFHRDVLQHSLQKLGQVIPTDVLKY